MTPKEQIAELMMGKTIEEIEANNAIVEQKVLLTKTEEYHAKVREERAREKHMSTEEFYEQMARSMGMKLKFIKKEL